MDRILVDKNKGIVELYLGGQDFDYTGNAVGKYKLSSHSRRNSSERAHRRKELWKTAAIIVAVLAIIGTLAFAILDWTNGGSPPPLISIFAKFLSFAFIGSLISFGAVEIISIQGELDSLHETVPEGVTCSFIDLSQDGIRGMHSPGNPRVCIKCPLGIELINETGGVRLIHNCKVYEGVHHLWNEHRLSPVRVAQPGVAGDASPHSVP